MKIFLLSLSLLFASLPANSAGKCFSTGCISTISVLYTTADGPIYISTPHDEKLANCTPVSDVFFTLNPDSRNAKEMYSSLLAAYMSGKKIQLRIKDGHPKCELADVRLNTSF